MGQWRSEHTKATVPRPLRVDSERLVVLRAAPDRRQRLSCMGVYVGAPHPARDRRANSPRRVMQERLEAVIGFSRLSRRIPVEHAVDHGERVRVAVVD